LDVLKKCIHPHTNLGSKGEDNLTLQNTLFPLFQDAVKDKNISFALDIISLYSDDNLKLESLLYLATEYYAVNDYFGSTLPELLYQKLQNITRQEPE